MNSRLILFVCSIAVLLLMSSSSAMADDQYNSRLAKFSNGAWRPVHQFQPLGKRGRFVFREAPDAQHNDPANDDDAQDADFNLDKRNWRL